MCIYCTFERHWKPVYNRIKNNSSLEGLPPDITFGIKSVLDYSDMYNVDFLDALKILFLERHVLSNPDQLQTQKHDKEFLEKLWLDIEK